MGTGAGWRRRSVPPVWGKEAKWCILSQRLGEMRNMAGRLERSVDGWRRWWWWQDRKHRGAATMEERVRCRQ